ncbi:MAG: sarcosine oxidase subunit gamma [Sulfitobacter sp.]
MDSLSSISPCAGLLPLTIGALTIVEYEAGPIISVSPFSSVSKSKLERALGIPFPAPGQSIVSGSARCIWVGQGEALLIGAPPPAAKLGTYAAVVDQSDAWALVTLRGTGGADALARLVPVDLRLSRFAVDATVRTQVGHMNASITRLDAETYLIAVFRSMAGTLVHDLQRALEAVAARG